MLSDTNSLRVRQLRSRLEAYPDEFCIYTVSTGIPTDIARGLPRIAIEYQEFLEESDGAAFGVIYLAKHNELPELQHLFALRSPSHALEWSCIGHVLNEPLAIEISSGTIILVHTLYGKPETLPHIAELCQGLDSFLSDYVFGPRYKEIAPDVATDDWWNLLQQLGWLVSRNRLGLENGPGTERPENGSGTE